MKKMIKQKLMQWLDAVPRTELEEAHIDVQRQQEYNLELRRALDIANQATESVKAVVKPHLTGRTYSAKLDNGRVIVQVHATQDARVNREDVIRSARNISLILWHDSPQVVEAAKSQIKLLEETT